jgi:hypothetical protein
MRDSAEPAGACIQPERSPRPLLLGARVTALHIGVLSLAILGLDFVTGPYIQVAILFVVPVALATWSGGLVWGTVVAVALPLVRLPFFFVWKVSSSWALEAADTAVDVVVLLGLVWVIQYIVRQQREIHALQGLLPICSFCKRIRNDKGAWLQIERYISDRSPARFSHTFCPDCGRQHYGELVE